MKILEMNEESIKFVLDNGSDLKFLKFDFVCNLLPQFKEDKNYKSGQSYLDRFRMGVKNCERALISKNKSVELVASLKDKYNLEDLLKEKCFCEFKLSTNITGSGVYLWVVDGKIIYVGEAVNFKARFNSGYGHISPRNIFKNGQSTNCKMNLVVSRCLMLGKKISIYFCDTTMYDINSSKKTKREEIEESLINYIGLDNLLNIQR